MNMNERTKAVLKAGIISIAANVLMALMKMVIGIITGSVAITMDAVNSLSDAGSGVITIITAVFAGKQPDKKHPFGYGRIEYLGTLLIAGLILYTGITAFIESVKKIIHPQPANYTMISLILLAAAAVAKLLLGHFIMTMGKKVNSEALEASGREAMGDTAVSVATIAAALVFIYTHISIEAWIGAVISALIVRNGFESLMKTISGILGSVPQPELVRNIEKAILETDERIRGAYDIVLHNYGPDSYMGSVHIAVEETMTANEIDMLIRKIETRIMEDYKVMISAVSIYAINTKDPNVCKMVRKIIEIANSQKYINSTHGFYVDHVGKQIRFDAVISFEAKDRDAVYNELKEKIQAAFPEYNLKITMDIDFNEL